MLDYRRTENLDDRVKSEEDYKNLAFKFSSLLTGRFLKQNVYVIVVVIIIIVFILRFQTFFKTDFKMLRPCLYVAQSSNLIQ